MNSNHVSSNCVICDLQLAKSHPFRVSSDILLCLVLDSQHFGALAKRLAHKPRKSSSETGFQKHSPMWPLLLKNLPIESTIIAHYVQSQQLKVVLVPSLFYQHVQVIRQKLYHDSLLLVLKLKHEKLDVFCIRLEGPICMQPNQFFQ